MSFFSFIFSFSMLSLLGSIAILSWYHITRHWQSKLPNGKIVIEGFLFKHWSLFWEKIVRWDSVYFTDKEQLKTKWLELNRLDKKTASKFVFKESDGWIGLRENELTTEQDIFNIESVLGNRVHLFETGSLFLYNEVPIYRFPEWIRNPISHCPTCMASVYGSIIWWGFVFLQKNSFYWSYSPKLCYFAFWILFCLVLSKLNTTFNDKNIL